MTGGKRKGAGRPLGSTKPEAKPIAIRLTEPHRAMFAELGGVRWLRSRLNEAIDLAIEKTKGK